MEFDPHVFWTVIAVLGGGTGIGSIIVALTTRSKAKSESVKLKAEAAKIIGDSYADLLEEYRKECIQLRQELTCVEAKVDSHGKENMDLRDQMIACEREIAELKEENVRLRDEVAELQRKNRNLLSILQKVKPNE